MSAEGGIVTAGRTAADIRDLVGPVVDALGCRLYDVEVAGSGRQRTVRVLVDRDGGVDLDTVTAATHAISPALDDADGLAGPFLLEVSSPGLERPLRRREHYDARGRRDWSRSGITPTAGPQRVRGVARRRRRRRVHRRDRRRRGDEHRVRRDHEGAHGVRVGPAARRTRPRQGRQKSPRATRRRARSEA